MGFSETRVKAVFAAVCAGAFLLAFSMGRFWDASQLWVKGVYLLSMVAGGWFACGAAWRELRRGKLDIDFLMIAVAVGAVVVGAWQEGALLLLLFSLSGALEAYALNRMNREISALTEQAPTTARVALANGETEMRTVEDLQKSDLLQVRPDEVFPTDGLLRKGKTEVDESSLTGESLPIAKAEGDEVSSGTLNLWGVVEVEVLRPAKESSLAKIIHLIRHAQESRAPSQRFTDRFGSTYAIGILGFSLVMFLYWWLVGGLEPFAVNEGEKSALYRAMTLLVVASPCALVLSIPSAILAGIAWGARKGILFRGGSAIEELAQIDVVALDKTGTLTAGEMRVVKIESFPPGQEDLVAQLACTLEEASNHPIARAITLYGQQNKISLKTLTDFRSLAGKGVQAVVEGEEVRLGRRELLGKALSDDSPLPEEHVAQTEVWIQGVNVVGRILLQDEIRKESAGAIARMHEQGLTTLMLTGDNRGTAEVVARDIGIDQVHAGLHPEDKVNIIRELMKSGKKVAMVGDGVNDAPSLAIATVSVSMGNRGSDAALEQADVVLMDDRIEKLVSAVNLSRKARAVIGQNLVISLGTVLVMVGSTLLSTVPLALAVFIHESSTVIVCLNSLRLLFVRDVSTVKNDDSVGQ